MLKKILLIFILVMIQSTWLNAQKLDNDKPKIVGGIEAQPQLYPWMASLVTDIGIQGCGATLIAPQWVLTAAHCVPDFPEAPENIQVLINSLTTDISSLEPYSELIDIEEIIVHPEYNFEEGGPDLALIRLAQPALTPPISLADQALFEQYGHGMPGKVLGWGRTQSGGSNAENLLVGNTTFIGSIECGSLYSDTFFAEAFTENGDGLICSGTIDGNAEIVGAAQGDSGGPLFYEENGEAYQVGVVSFGNLDVTTAEYPGVFTLVPYYAEWIEETLSQYENPTSTNSSNPENLSVEHFANQRILISNLSSISNYSLSVYTVSGRLLTKQDFQNREDFSIGLSTYRSGLYILQVQNLSNQMALRTKFVINQ